MLDHRGFKEGDIVEAVYKSGVYVGEVVGFSDRTPRAKVRVMAVLRHPEQGDLHRKGDVNVEMFHERKALSEREVALVPLRDMRNFDGEIPDYRASLKSALEDEIRRLEQELANPAQGEWARASLAHLYRLKAEYGF